MTSSGKQEIWEKLDDLIMNFRTHKDPCSCCEHEEGEDKFDGYKGNELFEMIQCLSYIVRANEI